jgi:electron transfer flavoprotein alpha subunit
MLLGLLEHDRGRLHESSFETLTAVRRLAAQSDMPCAALLIGAAAAPHLERLAAYGVSTVYQVEDERLADYAPESWAHAAADVIASAQPQAVIAAGTERGNEVMAYLAARLGLPMAANCTEVRPGNPYEVTRMRWGGSLLEDARLKGTPKLLTLAVHAVAAEQAPVPTHTVVQPVRPNLSDKDFRARVTGRVDATVGKVSLADARVVVGGGRGVGSAEGFKDLEELAELLGGTVGVSRVVTSLGWRPHSDQVGQTGTRIAPDLYIACGISGAIQHMVGCKSAKHILAINTDPDATMVSKADYAVIGDLHQVLPAISAAIRNKRKAS